MRTASSSPSTPRRRPASTIRARPPACASHMSTETQARSLPRRLRRGGGDRRARPGAGDRHPEHRGPGLHWTNTACGVTSEAGWYEQGDLYDRFRIRIGLEHRSGSSSRSPGAAPRSRRWPRELCCCRSWCGAITVRGAAQRARDRDLATAPHARCAGSRRVARAPAIAGRRCLTSWKSGMRCSDPVPGESRRAAERHARTSASKSPHGASCVRARSAGASSASARSATCAIRLRGGRSRSSWTGEHAGVVYAAAALVSIDAQRAIPSIIKSSPSARAGRARRWRACSSTQAPTSRASRSARSCTRLHRQDPAAPALALARQRRPRPRVAVELLRRTRGRRTSWRLRCSSSSIPVLPELGRYTESGMRHAAEPRGRLRRTRGHRDVEPVMRLMCDRVWWSVTAPARHC